MPNKKLLSFLFAGIALMVAMVFVSKGQQVTAEPLADARSLSALMAGKTLPKPQNDPIAWFHGTKVTAPNPTQITTNVLGATTWVDASNKHIEVDLTKQKVYAFEGTNKVMEFTVATGKWGPTPTGTFYIWAKVRSQLMAGGDKAAGDDYYLPNVPYVMFFYNDQVDKSRGFSFHGAYWHNNFGHPMSHGCVNMRAIDAEKLYEWATPVATQDTNWSINASADNPGTKVIIYGTPPEE